MQTAMNYLPEIVGIIVCLLALYMVSQEDNNGN